MLYKRRMWIHFKKPLKDKTDIPGFYFGIDPDSYGSGMGLYTASKDFMNSFRKQLKERADDFRNAVSHLPANGKFMLLGDGYKKTVDPDVPGDLQKWSQKKGFHIRSDHKPDRRLAGPEVVSLIKEEFSSLAPLYVVLKNIRENL